MNRISLCFMLTILILAGCQKKESQIISNNDSKETSWDSTYFIPGITDRKVPTVGNTSLVLDVTQNIVTDKRVFLSVKDFPEKMKGSFSTASGYPTFRSYLTISAMFQEKGTYPVKIVAKSEDGPEKEYTFDITVQDIDKKNCNHIFRAGFINTDLDYKSNSSIVIPSDFNFIIADVNTSSDDLYFGNILTYHDADGYYSSNRSLGNITNPDVYHVKCIFDCTNGDLDIPSQKILGKHNLTKQIDTFTISGNGKVDLVTNRCTISYSGTFNDGGTTKTTNYTVVGLFNLP